MWPGLAWGWELVCNICIYVWCIPLLVRPFVRCLLACFLPFLLSCFLACLVFSLSCFLAFSLDKGDGGVSTIFFPTIFTVE